MIPSDHFVRFYNEVFKYLDRQGPEAVADYFTEISRHQELHCLEAFKRDGLRGMYDYWHRISVEENCLMRLEVDDDCFHSVMERCPSLSKITDNDAGAWPGYCEHCPGWVLPVMSKAGYFRISNLVALDRPCCESFTYRSPELAAAKYEELKAQYGEALLRTNLPQGVSPYAAKG